LLATRDTPVQLQERIAGTDIRVHVVREQIFATAIRCQAIDYRRPGNEEIRLEAIELPTSIAAECMRITEQFGLVFSGVDLRETVEGRYYCFEVNPAPDFAFYEERTGQQISLALRDVLSGG
jgi:glutathione synthase/RimK-type ligase-like ATP-grasp enzyme